MTYKYSQRSPEDLLYELARSYPGGIEALATRRGISTKALYKRLSPRSIERSPTIEDFSITMEMCAGAGVKNAMAPLEAFCWQHGYIAIPVESVSNITDDDIRKTSMQAFSHFGNVAGLIDEALSSGEITDKEMEHIEPEKRKLFTSLMMLWERIKARNKDAKKRSFFKREGENEKTHN